MPVMMTFSAEMSADGSYAVLPDEEMHHARDAARLKEGESVRLIIQERNKKKMANNMMQKVPVREQDPLVRAKNFDEVCLGYDQEEAMEEAKRCLNCKNARCIQGCPVSIP